MDSARINALEREGASLTPAEIQAGWHFCPDWDYLLVGPGMSEEDCCCCHRFCRCERSEADRDPGDEAQTTRAERIIDFEAMLPIPAGGI